MLLFATEIFNVSPQHGESERLRTKAVNAASVSLFGAGDLDMESSLAHLSVPSWWRRRVQAHARMEE